MYITILEYTSLDILLQKVKNCIKVFDYKFAYYCLDDNLILNKEPEYSLDRYIIDKKFPNTENFELKQIKNKKTSTYIYL